MSDAELQFVRAIKFDQRRIPARSEILVAGESGRTIYTLFSGWAFRYMSLGDDRRQILDLSLPGDLIGLQAPMTGRITHSVRSITEVSLCFLSNGGFQDLFADLPGLSEALVATLLMEEQRADARLLMLGRQRPTERLAYLLLETQERLIRRGRQAGERFEFPLTYMHLADLLGLSRSQVASSLRELRQRQWAIVADGQAIMQDTTEMAAACSYEGLAEPALRALI